MSSSYLFTDRSELDTAIHLWTSGAKESAILIYGDISTWDVSAITETYVAISTFREISVA